MVELCFNQSAQGALKMAQHCGGKGRHSVGIVFCTSEDGEKPSRRAVRARLRKVRAEQDRLDRYAVPLGNKSSDVLCLGLALSLGDIAAPLAEDGPRRALFRQFHTDFPRYAVPLGNKSSDVLCLGLALSLGDIAAPLAEDGPRRALFRQFHTDFPLDGAEAERAAEADADWREVLAAAEELRARAAAGEEVRIWADDTPDGACGLRHAAALLAGLDARVTLVSLPRWWERPDGAGEEVRIWADDTPDGACGLRHAAALLAGLDARVTLVSLPRWWERPDGAVVRWDRGWGEVHPEEFGLHLGGAEELTRPVLRMLALEWERLREENAPLRAVVNGRVMGVSEDFYDPVLRRCLTEKPQKVANVLGQALVQLSGVGDWLLARRLRAMAEAGTVRVDEAGSTRGFYGAAANVLGQALVQLSGVGDWLLARRLRAMAEAGTVRVDEAGSTRGFYGAAVCLS